MRPVAKLYFRAMPGAHEAAGVVDRAAREISPEVPSATADGEQVARTRSLLPRGRPRRPRLARARTRSLRGSLMSSRRILVADASDSQPRAPREHRPDRYWRVPSP